MYEGCATPVCCYGVGLGESQSANGKQSFLALLNTCFVLLIRDGGVSQ